MLHPCKKRYSKEDIMTSRQKVLWGGLGGICPVLIMLITMDLQSWISNFNIYKIVGFLIRTLVLFALGAIIANLHNKIINKKYLSWVLPHLHY
jgi:hypothetical protein